MILTNIIEGNQFKHTQRLSCCVRQHICNPSTQQDHEIKTILSCTVRDGERDGWGEEGEGKKARKGNEAKANQFLQSRKQDKLVAFLLSSLRG